MLTVIKVVKETRTSQPYCLKCQSREKKSHTKYETNLKSWLPDHSKMVTGLKYFEYHTNGSGRDFKFAYDSDFYPQYN